MQSICGVWHARTVRHRKIWLQRAGLWETIGESGWGSGKDEKGQKTSKSIVEYGAAPHQATNMFGKEQTYIKYYAQNSTVTALLIDAYRNDYVNFGIQMPKWMCDPKIEKTDHLKRSIRNLPRTSRPPCEGEKMEWLWIAP